MNYLLGVAVKLSLIWMLNMQTVTSSKDIVFYQPVVLLKQDNTSALNEPFHIWINIHQGLYPNISVVDKSIKVNEPLTILIYLEDQYKYDIAIDECWAYDEQSYDNSTFILKLTTNHLESQKKKSILMNQWRRIVYPNMENVTVVLYTNITSFKFPEKEHVYINCSVQLCVTSCKENLKQQELPININTTLTENQPTTANENTKIFIGNWLTTTTAKTPADDCSPQFKHLLCILNPQNNCIPILRDVRCTTQFPTHSENHSTPQPDCHPGTRDPLCHTKPPMHCFPGSKKPECHTTPQPHCHPSSQDPQCISKPPTCYPGSQNPQCKSSHSLHCSQDPQCNANSSQSECHSGFKNSRCLSNPSTADKSTCLLRLICLPPKKTENTVSSIAPPPTKLLSVSTSKATYVEPITKPPFTKCSSSNSIDPRCAINIIIPPTSKKPESTTSPTALSTTILLSISTSKATYTQPTTKSPFTECSSTNSIDPRCAVNIIKPPISEQTQNTGSSTAPPTTKFLSVSPSKAMYTKPTTKSPFTECSSSNSIDPRCAINIIMSPTSKNPENTAPPTTKFLSVSTSKVAYIEPTTKSSFTDCSSSNLIDPRCSANIIMPPKSAVKPPTFPLPNCYPGSQDPRCTTTVNHKSVVPTTKLPFYPFKIPN